MGAGVIYFASYSPMEMLVHYITIFMVILFIALLGWLMSSNKDVITNASISAQTK